MLWETPAARLLARLRAGRSTGPMFRAARRTPALSDIWPDTGRSIERAATAAAAR